MLSAPVPFALSVAHQLLGAGDALLFDLLARDELHRQRAFLGDALDAATRDFHTLDGLRCWRFLRDGRTDHANQGNQVC